MADGRFSLDIGLAGWRCRLTVDAPGHEAEVTSLFGTRLLSSTDQTESEIILTRQEAMGRGESWQIRWQHRGVPGDLTRLLQSPEGRRFTPAPNHPEEAYTDTVLGGAAAFSVTDGALQELQSERWPLYLELVLIWLMMREGDVITLHAAVCAVDKTALVLIGPSGSGKSTLSAALSARGADYHGDENVFYQRTQRRLYVRPKSLGLRPGGLNLLSEPPGGQWFEAKPNDPKCVVALPPPVRPCPEEDAAIYFLDGFSAAPALQPATRGEMMLRLLRGLGHGDPSLDARLDAASEIAGRFPGWRLTVGPPEATAEMLIAHVRSQS